MKIPIHVAVIMDGNGRWAKERNLPRIIGHKEGVESVREIISIAREIGVKYLSLFTFSTENWDRPQDEIKGLFEILKIVTKRELKFLKKNGIRLRVIGDKKGLPRDVVESIKKAERETKSCDALFLYLAINYGGRKEIIDAVNRIVKNENIKRIKESDFKKFLYAPELPDPDLLIRTSGEMRISNFFLWEIAYTELYFTDKYWPDFRREDFLKAIKEYSRRERRFGKV
jgi:undecaprenyl diphosphate synthase